MEDILKSFPMTPKQIPKLRDLRAYFNAFACQIHIFEINYDLKRTAKRN